MRPSVRPQDAIRSPTAAWKIAVLLLAALAAFGFAAVGIALHWALGAFLARGLGLS